MIDMMENRTSLQLKDLALERIAWNQELRDSLPQTSMEQQNTKANNSTKLQGCKNYEM